MSNIENDSDTLYEAISMLWGYREEVAAAVALGALIGVLDRHLGPNAAIAGLLVVCLAVLAWPAMRGILKRRWLLGHWRRRLARSLNFLPAGKHFACPSVRSVSRGRSGWTMELSLRAGTSLRELEAALPYLESYFRAERVTLRPLASDRSRVTLQLRTQNPFDAQLAPPVLVREASAWHPIALGIDEDGATVTLELFEHNLLLGGEPGAGKSSALQILASSILGDASTELYLFDPKYVEFAPYGDYECRLIHAMPEALETLSRLLARAYERYQELQARGLRKWLPELGPLVVLIIDELPVYLGADPKAAKEFAQLLRELISIGRAAGVVTIAAAQKPSADSIPSGIRDLIDYRLAFRCATREASDVILGPGKATQGFSAGEIGAGEHGVGWFLGPGSEPRLMKAFYLDDDQLRDRLQRAQSLRLASRTQGESA